MLTSTLQLTISKLFSYVNNYQFRFGDLKAKVCLNILIIWSKQYKKEQKRKQVEENLIGMFHGMQLFHICIYFPA